MGEKPSNPETYAHIGVIGAGAWGTALAIAAARAGRTVTLWAREQEVVDSIASTHVNAQFLPARCREEPSDRRNDRVEYAGCTTSSIFFGTCELSSLRKR